MINTIQKPTYLEEPIETQAAVADLMQALTESDIFEHSTKEQRVRMVNILTTVSLQCCQESEQRFVEKLKKVS
jgi:hypothetical protein